MGQLFGFELLLIVGFLLSTPVGISAQPTFEKALRLEFSSGGSSVVQTKDGGFLIGCTLYRAFGPGGDDVPAIVKVDADGKIKWSRYLDYSNGTTLSVAATSDGGSIVTIDLRNDQPETVGSKILKLDADGAIQWTNGFGETHLTAGIAISPTGEYIVSNTYLDHTIILNAIGKISKINAFDINGGFVRAVTAFTQLIDGGLVYASRSLNKSLPLLSEIVKISADGVQQWVKQLDANVIVAAMVKTSDGGVAICGQHNRSGDRTTDMVVEKFDSVGNQVWGNSYDLFGFDNATSLTEDSDGTIIVCGNSDNDGILLTIGKNGLLQLLRRCSIQSRAVDLQSIIKTTDGGYAVTGLIAPPNRRDSLDMVLLKLDAELLGCNIQGLFCSIEPESISAGSLMMEKISDTVNSYYSTTDDRKSAGGIEFDLCDAVVEQQSDNTIDEVMVYPNPVTGEMLSISNVGTIGGGRYDITIRDILGREVRRENVTSVGEKGILQLSISNLPAGVYYVEVSDATHGILRRLKFVRE